MSKMLRNIIIMVALVVVAGGAILLTANLGKDEVEQVATPTEDPSEHIYVDKTVNDIVDLTIENGTGEYTLYKTKSSDLGQPQETPQPETTAPEQTGEVQATAEPGSDIIWKLRGKEDASLDQSKAVSLARNASYMYVNEVITEDMSRKAEFGLENYSAKVTVNFEDGTKKVFYYGSKVPAESMYYMYIEGVDKIFAVSSATYGSYMTMASLDLYSLNKIGIAAADMSEIKLERDGNVVFHLKPSELKLGLGTIDIVEPFRHMVNSDSLVNARTDIESLSVTGVADANGNFAKYGLDNPWGKLTVTDKNGYTVIITVGDAIDDTYTACAFEGDSNVYKIVTASLGIFNYNTYQMVDKYLAMISIENVTKVTLSGFGINDVVLGVEKIPQLDENGEPMLNTSDEPIYTYLFDKNGQKLSEENNDQGTWYYQSVIVPMSNTIITPEEFSIEGLTPEGSIVFDLSKDPWTYTVDFYRYNDDFYAVSVNGQYYLHKVADTEVEKLLGKANDFLNGTIVKPY